MPVSLTNKLVVAVSSRAVFNFEEENAVFDAQNDTVYERLQLERLDNPASPGVAFPLAKKLLAFNRGIADDADRPVEVVVLSRNDPVSGLRVFKSAQHHGLAVTRGVFTRGQPPYRYLHALNANLFLSANEADVRAALDAGFAAARVYPHSLQSADSHPGEVRIAFDGDAVLFSDEAERVYRERGLPEFERHEHEHAQHPLSAGPFKPFLAALHQLQLRSARRSDQPVRIRTALVTARSAPAHERAIKTLMSWGVQVDEAMFLGGLDKGPFLKQFQPDFFFDDQTGHCESAARVSPTGHVVSGIANSTTDFD
jgi:5'-nucleotidase